MANPQQPSTSAQPILALPMAMISPNYCSSHQKELEVVKKVLKISGGNFAVTDVNSNMVFKVKGSLLTDRSVLFNAAGSGFPIITFRRKIASRYKNKDGEWEALRGESTKDKDVIFTLKRSSVIQSEIELHVFLAGNTKEEVCDFKVKGSKDSCIVYAGESNNIVAKMEKKITIKSVLIGKDHLSVTVYPKVDYAFIVTLILIFNEEIKLDDIFRGGPIG